MYVCVCLCLRREENRKQYVVNKIRKKISTRYDRRISKEMDADFLKYEYGKI